MGNDDLTASELEGSSLAAASRSRDVDIVARLRQFGVIEGTLPEDAAREIERLRALGYARSTLEVRYADGIAPWSVEHTSKCRIHDHLFEENAVAADCSCGAILRSLLSMLCDAKQDIRDFFKAVDAGWLGRMPSGFNQSAFVVALRSRLNHAAAGDEPCSEGVDNEK